MSLVWSSMCYSLQQRIMGIHFFLMECLLNYLRDEWLREAAVGRGGCLVTRCLSLQLLLLLNPRGSRVAHIPACLMGLGCPIVGSFLQLPGQCISAVWNICMFLSIPHKSLLLSGVTAWTGELGLHWSLGHLQLHLGLCLPYCEAGIYSIYRYHPTLCVLCHFCWRQMLTYYEHLKNIQNV